MKNTLLTLLAFVAIPFATFGETETKTTTTTTVEQKAPAKLPTFDDILASFLDKTAKVGDKLGDAAVQVGDFAAKEIPLVIQEYLTWHWTESFFWSVGVGGIFLLGAGILFKKVMWNNWNKEWANSRGDLTELGVGVGFATAGVIILTIIGTITAANNLDWVKISVAPRVYLIDKAATFMKK